MRKGVVCEVSTVASASALVSRTPFLIVDSRVGRGEVVLGLVLPGDPAQSPLYRYVFLGIFFCRKVCAAFAWVRL